jgi:hypothetical protein
MKRQSWAVLVLLVVMAVMFIVLAPASAQAETIYVGKADLSDGVADGLVAGSPAFANDWLIVIVNNEGGRLVCKNQWIGLQTSGLNWHYTSVFNGSEWVLTKSQGVMKKGGQPPAVHLWDLK